MACERYLPGVFLKYNNNNGYVHQEAPNNEIAQAFSHFTFEFSLGKQMVLDLQGIHLDKADRSRPHIIMTDPQVVSLEKSFGPGDLGERGMAAFFKSHVCGSTCRSLRLDGKAWKKMRGTSQHVEPGSQAPNEHASSSGLGLAALAELPIQHWPAEGLALPMPLAEPAATRRPRKWVPPRAGNSLSESGDIMSLRPSVPSSSASSAPATLQTFHKAPPARIPRISESLAFKPFFSLPGVKTDGPLSDLMARTQRGWEEEWAQLAAKGRAEDAPLPAPAGPTPGPKAPPIPYAPRAAPKLAPQAKSPPEFVDLEELPSQAPLPKAAQEAALKAASKPKPPPPEPLFESAEPPAHSISDLARSVQPPATGATPSDACLGKYKPLNPQSLDPKL